MHTERTVSRGARASRRALGSALLVWLGVLQAACASYPDRTKHALADFQRGEFSRAIKEYEDQKATDSRFLSGAEAGTVALTAGMWDDAIAHYTRATDASRAAERAALISPESAAEEVMSWVLNDTFKEYVGEGYERVLVHVGLAMAYLARGEFSDAQVELRLSNQLLESEESLYEKQYRAGGLAHFVSAIVYELDDQLDEAYID